MAEPRERRHLAAILVADVFGYSRLMSGDESGTLNALNAHLDELVRPAMSEYSGRIVKTIGDGVLAEFGSAVDAVQCAVALQRGMHERSAEVPEDRRITFRIGINLGDVIVQNDDVFGDGVNVAARLEGLAAPGGIVISASVHEQVRGKLPQAFRDLGPQNVKNIPEPVHAFEVTIDGAGTLARPSVAKERTLPSIVVLPLDNMSEDASQTFFADGITEDVITELSRFPDLFVIARNSAFSYKGKAVKVQEIARELGVHYVVEGSVRRSGNRVRVTVQLIDAATGHHVYAERFDREIEDLFELQDEITQSIVATLPGQVRSAETERVRRQAPQSMAAYDFLLAGRIMHHRVTPKDNAEAIRLLDQAIALDPNYAAAYAWKGCVLGQSLEFGFGGDPLSVQEQAMAAVHRALAIDENDVECHRLMCEVYMFHHKLDKAVPHAERALALNPNDPRIVAQRGELLTWLGQAEEGTEWLQRAARLDPYGAARRGHLLGRALFGAGRFAEAVTAYRTITRPDCGKRAELAASFSLAGTADDAGGLVAEMAGDCAKFSAEAYVARLAYARREDREKMLAAMKAAGL
ncbi:MAG: adenylate/guanylate cyclase domain-containing protein [Cucumibacter sp.]